MTLHNFYDDGDKYYSMYGRQGIFCVHLCSSLICSKQIVSTISFLFTFHTLHFITLYSSDSY